ncbi:MAG: hypothetical protein J0L84_11200 [Verrucomicrobia bacterium]|nr:hypothetical protein [Verrucomicrobiota bacterium]
MWVPARHRWRPCVAFLSLLAYIALHFGLSRHSLRQVRESWGIDGYFYLPLRPETIARNERWLPPHRLLCWVFWPVRRANQALLRGPEPIDSMPMLSLGGERQQTDIE